MKQHKWEIFLLFLFALSLSASVTSASSAERVLPASVDAGEEFQITINLADYGAAGQVLEKLPEGFTFVSSSLPDRAVTVNENKLSFLLMGEESFTYTLKAPEEGGKYNFVGLLKNIDKNEVLVLPSSSSLEVNGPSDEDSGSSSSGKGSGSKLSQSSGKGGSSGGTGGAGSSPELQSNVEAKELAQAFVGYGDHVKFEFPEGATCVAYIEFDAKKTLGKITTIVEMLKTKSVLVSDLPEGKVYKNMNVWMGTGGVANSENLENAVVCFKVKKSWLDKSNVEQASVALWHYDNVWNKLETKPVKEDDLYVYFEGKTPCFGNFVIVADKESETSGLKEIVPVQPESVNSKNLSSDTKKSTEKTSSALPGFEFLAATGSFGAVYCLLRRKLR